MVDTVKFSEFANGGDLEPNQVTVGLESGANVQFTNPFPLLPPGATGDRPAPDPSMYYRLRFNTTLESYEYYSPVEVDWVQLEDSTDIATLLALLASHSAGEGASLIGLENQSTILNKTVQDLANATVITNQNDGVFVNGDNLASKPTGLLASVTGTGDLTTREFEGTLNQIDIANGDGTANPVASLSSTLNVPGTMTIQGSTVLDEIINDDTMATATASNINSALATKTYIDNKVNQFKFINPVTAASTADLNGTYDNGSSGVGATLTNAGALAAFSTDGITPSVNARILAKDQTNTFENGVYVLTTVGDGATPWVLTRATDFDEPSEIQAGDLVPILEGNTLEHTMWMQTAEVTTIGTSPIVFVQFGADFDNVVTIDGAQTITGEKTFSTNPTHFNRVLVGGDNTNNLLGVRNDQNIDAGNVQTTANGNIRLTNIAGTPGAGNLGNGIAFSGIGNGRRKALIASRQSGADANQTGISFFTNNTTTTSTDAVAERMRLNSDGSLEMLTGAITANSGIIFGGGVSTLNYFSNAQTYAPEITFATPGDLSVVYTDQSGLWSRLSDGVVWIRVSVAFTPTYMSASGGLRISLPFPVNALFSGAIVTHNANLTYPSSATWLTARFIQSSSHISLFGAGSGISNVVITTADIPSGTSQNLAVTGFYFL